MRRVVIAFFMVGLVVSSAVRANDDPCGYCHGIANWFERLGCVESCLSERSEAPPSLPHDPSDGDAVAGPQPDPVADCARFDTARLSPGSVNRYEVHELGC